MLKCDPDKVHSHDWLAGAIALGFGKIHVESKICARYRRLETSVTKISFTKKVKWLCSSICDQGDVRERNVEFYRQYKDCLPDKNRYWSKLFGDELSLQTQLKKVFYRKRWRPSLSSEVVMRFLMAIGKV